MQCKSEICNFSHSIVHEDVGNFQISMYNILSRNVLKSLIDVRDNGPNFAVLHPLFFLKLALQIPFVTELSDDITVSMTGKNFKASQDIRVIHFFKDFNFREE
jgi:hypothetical protein